MGRTGTVSERVGGALWLPFLLAFVVAFMTADHPHFKAPAGIPVVAALLCAFLASPFSGRPPKEYLFAAILIGLGALLRAINRAVVGRVDEFDPSRLGK